MYSFCLRSNFRFKGHAFWDPVSCSLIGGYQSFGRTFCLLLQNRNKQFLRKFVTIYPASHCKVSQPYNSSTIRLREKLNPQILFLYYYCLYVSLCQVLQNPWPRHPSGGLQAPDITTRACWIEWIRVYFNVRLLDFYIT